MRSSSGHPVVAALLDVTMKPLQKLREIVVPQASGRVLEIGVGTGLNAEHYDPSRVVELVGIEPDPHMLRRAQPRFEAADYPVELLAVGAEAMPFDDDSFDSLVVTFVLCTIPDVRGAVAEMHRVLKPGGVLHFVEHTCSDHRGMAGAQGLFNPMWGLFSGGCHLNRNAVSLLEEAGFVVDDLHGHGRGAFNPTPVHRGRATKR